LKRGDIVTVVLPREFGKPRPALVVQSDLFAEHSTVTVVPLTLELRDLPLFRITVEPTVENGLHQRSQLMIDKLQTIAKSRIGERLGRLEQESRTATDRALALWLGFA
jgi:mRNA interferase MazF